MKAMILAAGEGRRLRPLTEKTPKALIEVGGVPMIERVIKRLIVAGVDAVVVNVFHLADQVVAFLKARKGFGIRVEISREEVLLDTGGGLKKAAPFFDDGRPFFLHNVDVLSGLDLPRMLAAHRDAGALATLAVRARPTGRPLVFESGLLHGRDGPGERLAFDGVHVIDPGIFSKMTESGVFSITDAYLRLAGLGEKIAAFRADEYSWHDIGSSEKLEKAREFWGHHT